MFWPNGSTTRPTITKNGAFGPRKSPGGVGSTNHLGTDFIGFKINRAVTDGVVTSITRWDGKPPGRTSTPAGNRVTVDHGDFIANYAHNKSISVKKGQKVTAGQELGVQGATGNVTGKHLHFAIKHGGGWIDPVPFLTARITGNQPASGGNSTPKEWDDMASQEEVKQAALEAIDTYFKSRTLGAGPGGRNVWDTLKFIADGAFRDTSGEIAAAVAGFPVPAQDGNGRIVRDSQGNPVTYQLQGYLASIVAQLGGTVADVDETALAKALAPLLTANLTALSDADVERIAKAAADEQARRLAD